jgi:hypothetical protein
VNDPNGGRTYPLEGTMMLFPQYAPYTDPLGILICGGSTADNVAIDNCVSINPEATDADWTVERMPSKRVMPNMVALPDGTYLILNGAQEGVAGFGLADNPNLNAVQYDPSKPGLSLCFSPILLFILYLPKFAIVNQRMSVLANTTVARLYHSEAILLNDGRVLVSGSDPQDERFPEEYRIEVFLPPYLLSGLAPPNYSIADTDWDYSGNYVLSNVQIPSGSDSAVRVSLIGAVASTHGNSMGQRTLFPNVGCAGNTCTVQAPPDAHVAPPGWYQLFVLDGPTPSQGQFIRLGKDPAGIGNWPDFPDFQPLPGV